MERYGRPEVHANGRRLHVSVGNLSGVQTPFTLTRDQDKSELAGVALYTRDNDKLVILHLAVSESFAAHRRSDRGMLAVRLALAVRNIGRRLQGIRGVLLPYPARAS